jgi:hypothetical protein
VFQPPTWRTRSPYLYLLETGWPSYTPRHRVPILFASYDTHGLRWDYSYSPVSTRGLVYLAYRNFSSGVRIFLVMWWPPAPAYLNSRIICVHKTNSYNSTKQYPYSEIDGGSAGQEFYHLSCNPNIYYSVQNILPLGPLLSHMSPFHAFISYFLKARFNVILSSTSRSHKWSLSLGFPTKTNNYKKGKGKVVPVLFLTEQHAMKAYWTSGGITTLILRPLQ